MLPPSSSSEAQSPNPLSAPETMNDASTGTSKPEVPPPNLSASQLSATALRDAAYTGDATLFESLLSASPNPSALLDDTILLSALSGGVPVWKVILSYNHARMDAEIGHTGSALGWVVQKGDVKLLEYLIGEGADVEHAHRLYKPILPFARHIGASKEIIDMLVAHGATMKSSVWGD